MRRLEACQSPVWDTCLTVIALRDAGVPADHPALRRGGRLAAGRGDHRRRRLAGATARLAPGGWAFEFANDIYPDIDDTAEVVLALDRLTPSEAAGAAVDRGVAWTLGMQSRDGGWGAFDADNTGGWSSGCRSATSAR